MVVQVVGEGKEAVWKRSSKNRIDPNIDISDHSHLTVSPLLDELVDYNGTRESGWVSAGLSMTPGVR